ncbi:MAG: putative metal-binding motif-containing protein [Pseudomonadota bacterium]
MRQMAWLAVLGLLSACGGQSGTEDAGGGAFGDNESRAGAGAITGNATTGGRAGASSGGSGAVSSGAAGAETGIGGASGSAATNVGGALPAGGHDGTGTGGGGTGAVNPNAGGSNAGSGNPAAACTMPQDCVLLETDPPGCAEAMCRLNRCAFYARDVDLDHSTAKDCSAKDPAVRVTVGADCNDNNPAISPYILEVCNGVDDNCDGVIDAQVGTDDTKPPSPGAYLVCSGGSWVATSWHTEFNLFPADPAPIGVSTVNVIRLYDARGNEIAITVPTALFKVVKDAEPNHYTVDLNLDLLSGLPRATREPILQFFAGSGTVSLDIQGAELISLGFYVKAVGAPFRLN